MITEILEVLEFVHKNGVIHRDIKPQNIRRCHDGKIVLIDFGSVKRIVSNQCNNAAADCGENNQTRIGTPGYTPREQYDNPLPSCDIYAVGIIAFKLSLDFLLERYRIIKFQKIMGPKITVYTIINIILNFPVVYFLNVLI